MRNLFRNRVAGATLLALALVAAACGSGDDAADGPAITVSSFNFNESTIMAEIYAQALEAEGYTVERNLNLGNREVVQPALQSGEIDLVPEYVGSLAGFLELTATADSEATWSAAKAALEENGATLLDYSPAQDKNGYVVTAETAAEYGLSTVSDLAPVAGDLVFGGPPECPERDFCLPGLESVYGLTFGEFRALDAAGPLTVAALDSGDIDVGVLFTTQGIIAENGWVLLDDDQGLNPAENIVPAVNQEIVDAYGDDFVELLNSISAAIDTAGITALNSRADIGGEDPALIATDWLTDNGFIGG
jgi:osmoprotectant transport system substrate-binding protein